MIYIVVRYNYESTEIMGVYDRKNLAEELLEIDKNLQIEEYKLNELSEDGKRFIFYFIKDLKEKLNYKEEN